MKFKLIIFLFFLAGKSFGADNVKFIHEERNGVVSVEAEHFYNVESWEETFYYTSNGMKIPSKMDTNSGFLEYRVFFTTPGKYHFYLLGSKEKRSSKARNQIEIRFSAEDAQGWQEQFFEGPRVFATSWTGVAGEPVVLEVSKAGMYTLNIRLLENSWLYVDKLMLSLEGKERPKGTGPLETLYQEKPVDPVEIVLPPAWAFGVLYGGYTNQEQTLQVIDTLINGDYPIDAYWIDSYFWDFNNGKGPKGYVDFVGDTLAFPDVGQMWTTMQDKNIKSGIWIWNLINQEGNEEVFKEFNIGNHFSSIYTNRNGWHNADRYTITGKINFEKQETADLWKSKLKPFFDKGLDFLKLDSSSDPDFCKAAFTAIQEFGKENEGRGFILAHLSSIYDERFKLYPTNWTGDAKITWNQPDYPDLSRYAMGGYKENIEMVADPNRTTYQVPFLTHDAGGYDYFGSEEQSDELYSRWIQFSAMNSIMTIFSTAKNKSRNHPYGYAPATQDIFRKYTHLRMRLFPYSYTYAFQTRLSGEKMIRGDGVHQHQFMLGDALLIAPVFEPGARERTLYLPEGEWIDFENEQIFSGGKEATVKAPLDKLPMFVRRAVSSLLENIRELSNREPMTRLTCICIPQIMRLHST